MRVWSLTQGSWAEGDAAEADVRWYDLVGADDGLQTLAERFSLHHLAVEDCLSPLLHVPKIDDFGDYLFIVVQALTPGPLEPALEELDAFVGKDFLITYADRAIPGVEAIHEGLAMRRSVRPGPDGLFHAIFDRCVDDILPTVNAIGDRLDELQEAVLREPGAESNSAILAMRARAGRLRRVLTPQIAVAMRLSRAEFELVGEPNGIYFRDIYDHLVRIDIALEGVREDAEVALSTYLSAVSNRLNEVMKVLSVVSALALPAVVIAGVFGTNFDNVPGLHSNWGFTVMLGSMAAMAVGMALYFRRRGWF